MMGPQGRREGGAAEREGRRADRGSGVYLALSQPPQSTLLGHSASQSERLFLPRSSNSAALLDHLVGEVEHIRRNREAERLGSLEVDDQLELGRLLDG
jgi:hypothetical protein